MGFSVLGAIIMLALSLLAQSPLALKRLGLGGSTFNQRARSFSTYAFALMILGLGFFLAGVPLGDAEQTAVQTPAALTTPSPDAVAQQPAETEGTDTAPTPRLTPVTGAFGGPPPELASTEPVTDSTILTPSLDLPATVGPEETLAVEAAAPTARPTNTPAPTATPKPTATPTPTVTPFPTLTPTPISGETAVIDIGGGNVWLLRSPGGQNLVILSNGTTVILLDRKANQGGFLWQEVMTVSGIVGWLRDSYLVRNQ